MVKLIAVLYIKLVSIYLGISSLATGIFLQVIPPEVKKEPLVSEAVQLAFLNMLGLVGVAFFTNWKSNKIKNEVVAVKSEVVAVKAEVGTVKTEVGGVHKEVEQLKVNTDGALKEMIDVKEKLSKQLGIQEGIDKSKQLHEAQSEKEKDSNIAKGKIEGLAEAKAGATAAVPKEEEAAPVKVEIVQPEGKPAPVIVVEPDK